MDNLQQNSEFQGPQKKVPCAIASLILGIASIVTACCYGIPGLICSIIGLVLSGKGSAAYKADPSSYDQGSYKMLSAGKTCAIVGLILSIISIIVYAILIIVAIVGGGSLEGAINPFDAY